MTTLIKKYLKPPYLKMETLNVLKLNIYVKIFNAFIDKYGGFKYFNK